MWVTERYTRAVTVRRRTLIAGGVAGAVLLGAGTVGLGLRPTTMRTPRRALKVLSPQSFSVLAALADAAFPGGADLPMPWDVEVPEKVDATLATLHPADAAEIAQALGLLENALASAVLERRFSTFTAASPDEQRAIIVAWRHSALDVKRQAIKALVGLCAAAYWGTEATHGPTGYARRDYGQTRVDDAEVHWSNPRYLPPGEP